MKEIIKIIKNWKLYMEWKSTLVGKKKHYFSMGCGFYSHRIGREEEFEMKSGKRAVLKLHDYKMFRDPYDMVKSSTWEFSGYVGEKKLSNMTFDEYLNLLSPSPQSES